MICLSAAHKVPAPVDYFLNLRASTASPVTATANKPIVLAASGTRGGVPAKSGLAAKEDWQSKAMSAQTNNDFFIKVDIDLLKRGSTKCPRLSITS